uniref:AAA_14 domain-containing protein n=1 Tax=Caenorhabditis tropicalis TaxID=1561998 RepID=A0A1I7TJ38_9PELO
MQKAINSISKKEYFKDVIFLSTRTIERGLTHQDLLDELSKGLSAQKTRNQKILEDKLFDYNLDSLMRELELDALQKH